MNLRAWFERFAFSFVIIACALFYMAYQIYSGREPGSQECIAAYTICGALLLGIGLAAIRMRHRPRD